MVINDLGINFAGGGGGGTGSTAVLTSATFSANSAYTPAQGVDGWSAVTVNVDETPAYNSGYTEGSVAGFASGETVGYASGTTDGAAEQKALLSSTAITENGEYTSENGFSAVTVNVPAPGHILATITTSLDNEYIGNARALKRALYASVLAALTVKKRDRAVDFDKAVRCVKTSSADFGWRSL